MSELRNVIKHFLLCIFLDHEQRHWHNPTFYWETDFAVFYTRRNKLKLHPIPDRPNFKDSTNMIYVLKQLLTKLHITAPVLRKLKIDLSVFDVKVMFINVLIDDFGEIFKRYNLNKILNWFTVSYKRDCKSIRHSFIKNGWILPTFFTLSMSNINNISSTELREMENLHYRNYFFEQFLNNDNELVLKVLKHQNFNNDYNFHTVYFFDTEKHYFKFNISIFLTINHLYPKNMDMLLEVVGLENVSCYKRNKDDELQIYKTVSPINILKFILEKSYKLHGSLTLCRSIKNKTSLEIVRKSFISYVDMSIEYKRYIGRLCKVYHCHSSDVRNRISDYLLPKLFDSSLLKNRLN